MHSGSWVCLAPFFACLIRCKARTLQINEFKHELKLPENKALTHCEGHAIKCFVTKLIRAHDGSKKRDACLQSGYWFID